MKFVVWKKLGDIAKRKGTLERPARAEQVGRPCVSWLVGTALQRGCAGGGGPGTQGAKPFPGVATLDLKGRSCVAAQHRALLQYVTHSQFMPNLGK